LIKLLPRTKLFISGGGGLFQDIVSTRSPIFYGLQIILARRLGAQTLCYAQGIGPLSTYVGEWAAQLAFKSCDRIIVRDKGSLKVVQSWNLPAELTADPVWRLEAKPVPGAITEQVAQARQTEGELIGLSLRSHKQFGAEELPLLARAMHAALPEKARIVPIALHPVQDNEILDQFIRIWEQHRPGAVARISSAEIERPSQWITYLSQLDMLVGMRLHANIMALKSGVPTVLITYDPKVAQVAEQFNAPTLNITNYGGAEGGLHIWSDTLKQAVRDREALSKTARERAEAARNLACQNFDILARILSMQSDSN
jgi:polysaccharide pyruvyl transferase CsaB